jgi:hypothetical protein
VPAHDLSRDRDRLQELLANAWILSEDDFARITPASTIDDLEAMLGPCDRHPFSVRTREDIESPHLRVLRLFRNPDYFPFTCKILFGIDIFPFQHVILKTLWTKTFPMLVATRGGGKSFILALYAMLRLVLNQGCKVAIVGAAFRQAKVIFEYMEGLWANAHVLRDLCGSGRGKNDRQQGPHRDVDRCEMIVGQSIAFALPLGDGKRIRGQRANYIIADEYACLGAGTLVETDRGLVRIEEAADRRDLRLHTGDERGYETPAHFIRTPPTRAYRVTVRNGYSFVCSGIHQVLTRDGWKLGREVVPGDLLPMPTSYRFPDERIEADGLMLDESLAWCLGLLVSEGAVNSPHTVAVWMTDPECVRHFAERIGAYLPPDRVKFYEFPAHTDPRGWACKASLTAYFCHKQFRTALETLGLERRRSIDKRTPWSILRSPKEVVVAYLAGLFEGDGSAFLYRNRGRDNHLGVAFYTASEQLVRETQILLLKLGIHASLQSRASKLSPRKQWMLRVNGDHAHRLASLLDIPKWRPILAAACPPKDHSEAGVVWDATRGQWKAEIHQCGRCRFLGRYATREEALERVRREKVIPHEPVVSVEELPGEQVLYDFYLPEGHRFVANGFVQHNSIPEEIYQNVVRGFASVSGSPVGDARDKARSRLLKTLGMWTEEHEAADDGFRGNQNIVAGTAYYAFNHFAKTWRQYKAFIESRGDPRRLEEIFQGPVPPEFDWRDFAILRLPASVLPRGFMDEKQLAASRITVTSSVYAMEYGAVFVEDSDGFFRRSLIEKCVVGRPGETILLPDGTPAEVFPAALRGSPSARHWIGVDPASEKDNFAVVVLADHGSHRRVVYCWTIRKKQFRKKLEAGLVTENDFYGYCARKIRQIMRDFPNVAGVCLDSQGGGVAVEEALRDPRNCEKGELPVYEVISPDPKDYKPDDDKPGEHVLYKIHFADAVWVAEANHGMRKDFETRTLLFPQYDAAGLELAALADEAAGRVALETGQPAALYDTLEDAVLEIEELKDELAQIVMSRSPTGRDRWDTPGGDSTGRKQRPRKDRYSALLMANAEARRAAMTPPAASYQSAGGFAHQIHRRESAGLPYHGPGWFVSAAAACPGIAVRRR